MDKRKRKISLVYMSAHKKRENGGEKGKSDALFFNQAPARREKMGEKRLGES